MERLLKRQRIATKVLITSLLVGLAVWFFIDKYQAQQLRRMFMDRTEMFLLHQAEDDRRLFDQHLQGIYRSARLIVGQKRFLDFIDQLSPALTGDSNNCSHAANPPDWLPKSSVLRTFFNARYAIIYSPDGRMLSTYHNAAEHGGEENLPKTLRQPSSILRKLSHNQAYMTMIEGQPYIIASDVVDTDAGEYTLALMSPIDNHFLQDAMRIQNHPTVIALVDVEQQRIISSSDEQLIPENATLDSLTDDYLTTGKSFFDYGASDLTLQFSTFVSTRNAEETVNMLLKESNRQRLFLALALIAAFMIMIMLLVRRVVDLRERVVRFTADANEQFRTSSFVGDEIDVLNQQFREMVDAVKQSRARIESEMRNTRKLALSLERYAKQLETARDVAERSSRAKSDFLSSMSHELRTPLNAVMGFSQLLLLDDENGLNQSQRESVEEIVAAGEHLLALINDLLDLSSIESGKFTISLSPVPLDDVLQESLRLVEPMASKFRINLDRGVPGLAGQQVQANLTRLRQVMLNLLSNAIKYNTEGGCVSVAVEDIDDQWLRVCVNDTGKGIASDKLELIFEPFERLDNNGQVDGSGVGLMIARHLVELMGGRLGVESQPGEGSAFWVELRKAPLES